MLGQQPLQCCQCLSLLICTSLTSWHVGTALASTSLETCCPQPQGTAMSFGTLIPSFSPVHKEYNDYKNGTEQNKIFQLEGTHSYHPVQQPEHVRADQRLRILSKFFSNNDRPGALSIPSGSLIQCLTTLLVKKRLPMSSLQITQGWGICCIFCYCRGRELGKGRINVPRNLSLKNKLGYLSYSCCCAIVYADICCCDQLLNSGKEILK